MKRMPFDDRGHLLPGNLSPLRPVPADVTRPPYVGLEAPPPYVGDNTYSEEEIEKSRAAGRIASRAIDAVGAAIRPGVTTDELDRIAHDYVVSHGAYPSTLGYRGFPKSSCTSVNEVICHGIPDDTVLREGEETPVHEGAAARLPLAPGRYVVTGSTADRIGTVTAEVTAGAPAEIVVPLADALPRATVTPARSSVDATTTVGVTWTGPNEPGDYLVIAPTGQGQEEPETRHYAWTSDGSPATLRAPAAVGSYEVRYVLARAGRPIGRAPITVTPVSATLAAPAEAPAGSPVAVQWTGPRAPGSWIGIVPAGAPPAEYVSGGFLYVEDAANPLSLTAPGTTGPHEIRFVEGIDGTVLATRPLTVTAASATLQGPESGMAGSPVTIRYAPAQAAQGSFVAIVPPGADAAHYIQNAWAYVDGGEATINLPPTAGTYELRYVLVAPGGAQVLLRRPITATPATATLEAPATAAAGAAVTVAFTGPRGNGDYIAIAAVDAAGDQYIGYFNVGSEAAQGEITLPDEKGTYELRYVMGAAEPAGAVLARRRITVH